MIGTSVVKRVKNDQEHMSNAVLEKYLLGKISEFLSKHLWRSWFFVNFHAFSIFLWTSFWRIRAWSMKIILWKVSYFRHLFKQNSDCKSLIAKTFHGNTLKMKAASPIQVIQNKKQCLQLFLDRRRTLVLRTRFSRARWNKSVQSWIHNTFPPLTISLIFHSELLLMRLYYPQSNEAILPAV